MALSAGESFSGGQVRDSKSRSVVISETTNAVLSAGEFYSAGFLCDPDSRTVICQDTAHSALVAGETLTGGDVRDKVGRIACAVETLNAPISAGSQFSDGWLNDSQGRRIIALDTLGAALVAGEQFTSGQVRDSVGRLVLAPETAPSYASTVLADTPIVFYPMNDSVGPTILDQSGNGLNATLVGAPTLGRPGIGDGKTSIGGFTALIYITIPAGVSIPGTHAMTVEFFTNPAAATWNGCWQLGVYANSIAAGASSDTPYSDNNIYFDYGGQAAGSSRLPTAWVPNGAFHHICLVANTNFMATYVDGALLNSQAAWAPPAGAVASGSIGRGFAGATTAADVAKFAVYNYALSPARIAAHYAARLS